MNCCVEPTSREALAGVIMILDNTAAVTVRTAELLAIPNAAVMDVWPATKLVASPFPLIVATDELEELHWTSVVKSCVLPSLNVPLAVNGWVVPAAMLGLVGLTVSPVRVADVTVSNADPLTVPTLATTVVCPGVTLVAIPFAEIVATEGLAPHDTDVVMFC